MKKNLHKIKVNLYENFLTEHPNDYSAKVISERSLNVKEICSTAVGRGEASTTIEAMEHNVMLFLKEMAYQLMDGYSVNTGYFTANAQVHGVFYSADETFDPQKHALRFRFNQGELLRKEIPNVAVQIMGMCETGIVITQVVDAKTGTINHLLTANGNLNIKGEKLKIAGTNKANGIYFINQNTGARIKVETSEIVSNYPSELIILVPDLEAGKYKIEIMTQFSQGANLLKEPRGTVYDKVLIVP